VTSRRASPPVLRTIAAPVAIGIALLVVLRPIVLGDGLSGVDLVTTAAVLLGVALFLRWQGGRTRTVGVLLLIVGLVVLTIGIAVVAFSVLWCCP
jgi:hypothetical protein